MNRLPPTIRISLTALVGALAFWLGYRAVLSSIDLFGSGDPLRAAAGAALLLSAGVLYAHAIVGVTWRRSLPAAALALVLSVAATIWGWIAAIDAVFPLGAPPATSGSLVFGLFALTNCLFLHLIPHLRDRRTWLLALGTAVAGATLLVTLEFILQSINTAWDEGDLTPSSRSCIYALSSWILVALVYSRDDEKTFRLHHLILLIFPIERILR